GVEGLLGNRSVEELAVEVQRSAGGEDRVLGFYRTQPQRGVLLAAQDVGGGEGGPAVLHEVLDVGVVTVVEPALLTQLVEEDSDRLAVLAEVAQGEGQRVEVRVSAADRIREAHGDRSGEGGALEDQRPSGHRGGGRQGLAGSTGGRERTEPADEVLCERVVHRP